jgi:hypothetical protein
VKLTTIGLLAAGASLAGVLGAAGANAIAAAGVPWVGATPQPANHGELDAIAQQVDAIGRGQYGQVYAGLFIDTAADRVRVWRKPSANFDRAISKWRGRLVVADAAHSTDELEQLHTRIRDDRPVWESRGFALMSSGARYDGSCVEVGTADPVRADVELRGRYGHDAPLCFTEVGEYVPF